MGEIIFASGFGKPVTRGVRLSGSTESDPIYAPVLVESAERAIEYIHNPDLKRECVLLVNIGGNLQQLCGVQPDEVTIPLVYCNHDARENFSNVCILRTETNGHYTYVTLSSFTWNSNPRVLPGNFDYEMVLDVVDDARIDGNRLTITGTDGFAEIRVEFPLQDRPGPIAGISPKTTAKPKAKPAPKPAAKPKTAPTPKPTKKKTPAAAPKPAKKGLSYEVRVNGAIRATFSSKAKAEAEKKKLKAKGEPAKIVIVGY